MSLIKKIFNTFFHTKKWVLIYRKEHDEKWSELNQPKDVSRADPFIIKKNKKTYIFFEEFKIAERKGYICVGELDLENNKLINVRTVLKKKYHLSFPFIFEYKNDMYMIPESHENSTLDLYIFDKFPIKLKKVRTLLKKINTVDSLLIHHDKFWWIFTNIKTSYEDFHAKNLSIFYSKNFLTDDFIPHRDNPVVTNPKSARNAGNFIKKNDTLYRVSQDCSDYYGRSILISEIRSFSKETYLEKNKINIYPPPGYIGFHTYNLDNDIIIADAKEIVLNFKTIISNIRKGFQRLILKVFKH